MIIADMFADEIMQPFIISFEEVQKLLLQLNGPLIMRGSVLYSRIPWYVLACGKFLLALKTRMSLLQILQNAATSKKAILPSIGILAGTTLGHLSKYGIVPMEALGNALPFMSIAAINIYATHQEAGKISKYIIVGSCQTFAYAGTCKSHVVVAMVACWARS